jgi:ankyrin repeat protein
MLVEEGADVEALGDEGDRPLHLAACEGHLEVRVLVEAGANVEAELAGGERPLHLAAQGGHAEVVQMLLVAGADVEAKKADELRRCTSRQKKGIWRL